MHTAVAKDKVGRIIPLFHYEELRGKWEPA
jgi:hypothetical protein